MLHATHTTVRFLAHAFALSPGINQYSGLLSLSGCAGMCRVICSTTAVQQAFLANTLLRCQPVCGYGAGDMRREETIRANPPMYCSSSPVLEAFDPGSCANIRLTVGDVEQSQPYSVSRWYLAASLTQQLQALRIRAMASSYLAPGRNAGARGLADEFSSQPHNKVSLLHYTLQATVLNMTGLYCKTSAFSVFEQFKQQCDLLAKMGMQSPPSWPIQTEVNFNFAPNKATTRNTSKKQASQKVLADKVKRTIYICDIHQQVSHAAAQMNQAELAF